MAVGMRAPRAGGGVTMAADEPVVFAGAVVTPGGIEAFEAVSYTHLTLPTKA